MQNVTTCPNRNIRHPNKFGAWDKKPGFFIPRTVPQIFMINSPDDRLREWEKKKKLALRRSEEIQ